MPFLTELLNPGFLVGYKYLVPDGTKARPTIYFKLPVFLNLLHWLIKFRPILAKDDFFSSRLKIVKRRLLK